MSYVKLGQSEGAKLELGGQSFKHSPRKGYFIEPTIFTNVSSRMRIYQEEVFGPFVVVARFSTEEDAIRMANETTYGLGSALFTTNLTRAHRVARRIEAGMVWINSSNDSDWRVPFGGVKSSGIGRELGEAGLAAYSNIKAVHVNMKSKL
jgi:aldehyde dehydrogenase (NAD(P)+)